MPSKMAITDVAPVLASRDMTSVVTGVYLDPMTVCVGSLGSAERVTAGKSAKKRSTASAEMECAPRIVN